MYCCIDVAPPYCWLQVEYTMVPAPGGSSGWKIAAALVLGK
jgi:hypothetical protein